MERKLEKEVMDDKDQVLAYAKADFSSSNNIFIDQISNNDLSRLNRILDLGCGPAAIPIGLADKFNGLRITAVDASQEMLDIASEHVKQRNLNTRIKLVHSAIPGLKEIFKDESFDIIISKDLLHHLPDPLVFWEEIKSLSGKETLVYVMDLERPKEESEAEKIVEVVAGDETEVLKEDFYNSLLAAFEITEIKQQLETAGLDLEVEKFGSRHFLVKGVVNGN